ncbi:MAG: class I SAM-dependent methyltransferase [Deltaproteobacteria bacterium]|nr:class I SAM-dependent methyltransferase [Deltaproteobacteria bacterium]
MSTPENARECRCCRAESVTLLLDFGPQPLCNRLRDDATAPEATFPLRLGQCRACGVLQLDGVVAAAELTPRGGVVHYREAEGHLDDLVSILLSTVAIEASARVVALTDKDTSTLDRLKALGFANQVRLRPQRDFGAAAAFAGVETVQSLVDPEHAARIVATHGAADVVVARHVLEHAHDLGSFVAGLQGLLSERGVVVLEVPEFTVALDTLDYSAIWEEHVVYFTPATLMAFLQSCGFEVIVSICYPYALENSRVVIARVAPGLPASAPTAGLETALARGRRYADQLAPRRRRLQQLLAEQRRAGRRVAMFGAGHVATKLINLMGLAEHLEFVVDDSVDKQRHFMPGSGLPILPSSALLTRGIDLCLLSQNPESEKRVVANQSAFLARGGRLASLFARSPRALEAEHA